MHTAALHANEDAPVDHSPIRIWKTTDTKTLGELATTVTNKTTREHQLTRFVDDSGAEKRDQ